MPRLPHEQDDGPVTIIIKHQAKRGREQEFRVWLKNINAAAMSFAGFMGVQVIEPRDATNAEYVIIVRFDNYQNLKVWNDSDIRRQCLGELAPLTVGEGTYTKLSGLEYWFTLPETFPHVPPPKHKMAVVAWLAVTPLLLFIRPIVEPSLNILGIQQPFNVLVSSAIFVMAMTYFAMPIMTKLFKPWLLKQKMN